VDEFSCFMINCLTSP